MGASTLALATLLALPPLGVLVVSAILVAILALPSLLLLLPWKSPTRNAAAGSENDLLLKHAVITGGSSGIGLAIALECVRRGCSHVTLLARNEGKLKEAKSTLEQEIARLSSPSTVRTASVDVTDPSAIAAVASDLCDVDAHAPENCGVPPTLLFNCAGTSVSSSFAESKPETFANLMNVNYLGTVYTTHAFLPYMRASPCGGTVVLTSSAAGQVGVFGYTAYAPSKYALRGFAEALQMELVCDGNVNVQVAYPPDTDTPGYRMEQEGKPRECHLISEAAGLFDPSVVGKQMVREAIQTRPRFTVYFGLEGWMLSTLCAGMSPVNNALDATCQVALMGLLRLVSLFYLADFRRIVRKCHDEKAVENGGSSEYGAVSKEGNGMGYSEFKN